MRNIIDYYLLRDFLKLTVSSKVNWRWTRRTPKKESNVTRLAVGRQNWKVRVDRQKLQIKQRIQEKEEKILRTKMICNEEIERTRIEYIPLKFGNSSKKKQNPFWRNQEDKKTYQ